MLVFILLVAVNLSSPQPPADYERGLAAYDAGQFREAKVLLRGFLLNNKEDPFYPDALYLYGRLEADGEKARAIFLHLVANYPASRMVSDALLMIAMYHYANDEFDEASSWLRRLLSRDQGSHLTEEAERWLRLADQRKRGKSWAVQAGAFSNRDNAQELVTELKALELPVVLVKRESAESTLWVVRVGYYESRAEALASQRRLKDEGHQTMLVEKQWRN